MKGEHISVLWWLNCFFKQIISPTSFKVVLVVLPREPPAERHRGSVSAALLVDQTDLCLHVYTAVQEFYKPLQDRKCLPEAHVTVVFNTHAQQFQPFSSPGTHGVYWKCVLLIST